MVEVDSKNQSYKVYLPEDVKEITPEYFNGLLGNIKLQKNYCVVAICYYDKIFNVVSAFKNKKDGMTSIIPVIAKIEEDNVCGFKQMERAEINRTDLERGHHLNISANAGGLTNFINYVTGDKDLYKDVLAGKYPHKVIFVEFKIVPLVSIIATRDNNIKATSNNIVYKAQGVEC